MMTLPQLDQMFLTDAGLETDIVFNHGIDLPHFSSITLLMSKLGTDVLAGYYRGFLDLAAGRGIGFILESPTWRASSDWAQPLGLTLPDLDNLNREAIILLRSLRAQYQDHVPGIVVSGCIGPRGDGYDPGRIMTAHEAETYHHHQMQVLASAGIDMIAALTMTNVPEAIGIANAARSLEIPLALSFTTETDGRLPTGDLLAAAVEAVDQATEAYPAYYMLNCAHPTHFSSSLEDGAAWMSRIRGLRANASRCSHAELDAMTRLDASDPSELAAQHRELQERFPHLTVLGGCCGTDISHVAAIAAACVQPRG